MAIDEKYPLALPEGTILAGQYTIEKVLGQGGFGITYRANDYKTDQKVAVKEFFPDTLAYREATTVISYPGERSENYEYGKESFLQEAQTLAAFIGNENIVRIHSYFEENGTAYFVMDYIEGKSFDEYIKEKGGKTSVEEAKAILVPVMDALNVVHSKGIVHRDVTPDNIYITSDGIVKLLDFGAARYSLGDKSRSLDVILKHGFAPKEQYTRRGKQGPFTDIYSLGATFYFAITGKRPPDSVDRLDEDDLIPPSNLGVDITEYQEKAILQALSVQPADRFQSMDVFKKVLLNENTVTNQIVFTVPETAAVPMVGLETTPIQQGYPVTQQGYPENQQGYPTARQGAPVGQNVTQAAQNVALKVQPVLQKLKQVKHKKLVIGIACAVIFAGIVVSRNSGAGFSSPEKACEAYLNGLYQHDFDLVLKAIPDYVIEYNGKAGQMEEIEDDYDLFARDFVDQGYQYTFKATGHSILDKDEAAEAAELINFFYDTDTDFSAVATIECQQTIKNENAKSESTYSNIAGYAVKYKGKWYYFDYYYE